MVSMATASDAANVATEIGGWAYEKWVSRPAQNRSEQTFFRLLDAAEGLLSARHWHEVSVHEIVRRADASVGSFYNRFSDKAALLHCLDDRMGQECEQTIDALIAEFEICPALVAEAPGIIISLFVRLCHERRGVIRALDVARKTGSADTFTGLGPKFDRAMEKIGNLLAEQHDALKGRSGNDIAQAFRENFWLTREMVLYEKSSKPADEVHQLLLRHFNASLGH